MITSIRIHELKADRRAIYTDDVYQHHQAFNKKEAQAIREVANVFGIRVLISVPDGAILSAGEGEWFYGVLLKAIRTRFIFGEQFAPTSVERLVALEKRMDKVEAILF